MKRGMVFFMAENMRTLTSHSWTFRWPLFIVLTIVFIMYCLSDNGTAMFDRITEKIEDILSDHPSASICICGDFNVHNVWLIPPDMTNEEGKHCHDFPVAYELTQIMDKPTCVPNISGHYANLFHLLSCQMFC